MSEREDNPNQFFEVDENRVFPRPIIPPIRVDRRRGAGLHASIRIAIGIAATFALAMIVFGVAAYELSFASLSLMIPGYGTALLIYAICLFNLLRYIGDEN